MHVFANPVLQQGKAKNQAKGPQHEQENQRQRPEVPEKILPPARRLNMTGNFRPRSPRIAIKPGSQTKLPPDSAGKNDGFKRIQQDEENEENTGNGGKNRHKTKMMLRPEMVADFCG